MVLTLPALPGAQACIGGPRRPPCTNECGEGILRWWVPVVALQMPWGQHPTSGESVLARCGVALRRKTQPFWTEARCRCNADARGAATPLPNGTTPDAGWHLGCTGGHSAAEMGRWQRPLLCVLLSACWMHTAAVSSALAAYTARHAHLQMGPVAGSALEAARAKVKEPLRKESMQSNALNLLAKYRQTKAGAVSTAPEEEEEDQAAGLEKQQEDLQLTEALIKLDFQPEQVREPMCPPLPLPLVSWPNCWAGSAGVDVGTWVWTGADREAEGGVLQLQAEPAQPGSRQADRLRDSQALPQRVHRNQSTHARRHRPAGQQCVTRVSLRTPHSSSKGQASEWRLCVIHWCG